jgi:fatty acid desaturase
MKLTLPTREVNMNRNNVPKLPEPFFQLNNAHGPIAWGTDIGVIALSIIIAMNHMGFYPLALLLIGARQRALATLLHEASHRTLARNRRLNDFLGTWLSGYLIFQTWEAYRSSHVSNHHGRFGSAEDPDFAFHREIGLYENFTWRNLLLGLLKYTRYLIMNRLVHRSARKSELVKMLLLWLMLTWLMGIEDVVIFWLIPLVFSFGPIGYAIEIAEHWPLMRADEALYQTRNRASSWLEGQIFSIHKENFHALHHLYPRLPFSAMPAVDRYLTLHWPEYRRWSEVNGGILFSSNGAPSVMRLLINAASKGVKP